MNFLSSQVGWSRLPSLPPEGPGDGLEQVGEDVHALVAVDLHFPFLCKE